jgi:phosphoribosylaminoimidazolecarboxamide formyltransferase/IMP cyclohydrolase
MPRALISVSDKTGLELFAQGLVSHGYELLSTGGTAQRLAQAGLDVLAVSAVTGEGVAELWQAIRTATQVTVS